MVQISLDSRYVAANGSECLLSVDCVDFSIQEPFPFDPIWYSHKFNGPGVRYELGVVIQTGYICWKSGPFPCGEFNDLEIFQLDLKEYLHPLECVEADEGYRGDDNTRTPHDFEGRSEYKIMKGQVRARHETINRRFKEFKALGSRWRGDKNMHHVVFHAVAFIIQCEIEHGRATFDVEYRISRVRQV